VSASFSSPRAKSRGRANFLWVLPRVFLAPFRRRRVHSDVDAGCVARTSFRQSFSPQNLALHYGITLCGGGGCSPPKDAGRFRWLAPTMWHTSAAHHPPPSSNDGALHVLGFVWVWRMQG
jgi:hypothetical protein